MYTVESNRERFYLATKNFEQSGLTKHITQILGHAPEDIFGKKYPFRVPRTFDMAFFDATKAEHVDYFKMISPGIKKGGMIITDNTISHKEAMSGYFETIKKAKGWESVELKIGSGMMVSYKK